MRMHHVCDNASQQLLELTTGFKYERPYRDRPGREEYLGRGLLARFFAASDASPQPAKARLQLLGWPVFQVLLGNTDAHAKNLSFYMTVAGPVQAPRPTISSAARSTRRTTSARPIPMPWLLGAPSAPRNCRPASGPSSASPQQPTRPCAQGKRAWRQSHPDSTAACV